MIQYPHNQADGGDAIAGGFVYRGRRVRALQGKLVFGDITTGRVWYSELAEVLAADDGKPETVAAIHEIDAGLRRLTEQAYRKRGGKGEQLPGTAAVSGRGRVDFRFAVDNAGEAYVLTKSDGMIREIVGARATTTSPAPAPIPSTARSEPAASAQSPNSPGALTAIPESIAAGRKAYDANCAACHGNVAQGAVKAGTVISIIEEQRGKQPPDLTDDQWDHGSSDAEIVNVIKRGLPPTMMAGYDGRLSDVEIRAIVRYLRFLAPKKD